MKRSILTLMILPALLIIGCTPAEQEAAEEEADTLQTQIQEELREFRAEADEALADVDVRIDSLEAMAEEAGDEMSAELDSVTARLRERRDAVQQDLQELNAASEQNYRGLREDIETELEELENDVQAAWDRYADEDENPDA